MPTILTDFGSSERLALLLEDAAILAEDTYEPMAEIALDMMRIEEQTFASGGRRGGGSWRKLKPDTIARKGNAQILKGTETESLFKSLTEIGHPNMILDIQRTTVEFGTDVFYAGIHQEGALSRGIPRRPFIKFTKYDRDRWDKILLRHLMKPFRAHAD